MALDSNGDLVGNRVHLKGAVLRLRDGVVVRTGIAVKCVGEGVIDGAGIGDGAAIAISRALTLGEAGNALHLVLGVLRTVVGPLTGSGLHGDGRPVDDQGSALGLNGELTRDVVAISVLDHGRPRDVVAVGAGVSLCGVFSVEPRDGVGIALDRELVGLDALSLVLLAVIGGGRGISLDRNLVLGVTVGDRQRALGLGDVVVICLGVVLELVAERVGAGADERLGARELVGRALALDKTLLRFEGGLSVREGGAVVRLAQVGGLERNVALCDVDIAVGHVKDDIGEVRRVCAGELLGLQTHIRLAGIGARGLGSAREGDLVLSEQVVVGREAIALRLVLFAVIGGGCGLADDGDDDLRLDRVDGQLALFLCDDIVAALALGRTSRELIGKDVVAGTSVGLGSGDVRLEALAVNEAVARCNHVAVGKGRAVIGLAVGRGGQGHLALGDGHRAVFDLKGHIREVLIDVGELLGLQPHAGCAGIGALGGIGTREGEVGARDRSILSVVLAINGHTGDRIAAHALLDAVVLLGL